MATRWMLPAGPKRSAYFVYWRCNREMIGQVRREGRMWVGVLRPGGPPFWSHTRRPVLENLCDRYEFAVLAAAQQLLGPSIELTMKKVEK